MVGSRKRNTDGDRKERLMMTGEIDCRWQRRKINSGKKKRKIDDDRKKGKDCWWQDEKKYWLRQQKMCKEREEERWFWKGRGLIANMVTNKGGEMRRGWSEWEEEEERVGRNEVGEEYKIGSGERRKNRRRKKEEAIEKRRKKRRREEKKKEMCEEKKIRKKRKRRKKRQRIRREVEGDYKRQ